MRRVASSRGLAAARAQSFFAWCTSLREALQACGAWAALQGDDAGRQVISSLHLADAAGDDAEAMTLDDYTAWVHAALEDASFVPRRRATPTS
jgi:hypothetical protein